MTKGKHDELAHKELLKRGQYKLIRKERSIHLDRVDSYFQGSGYGTAVMREVVKEALEQKKTVTLDAAWSSHIFHLYMGMIPNDHKVSYLNTRHGLLLPNMELLKNNHSVEDLTNPEKLKPKYLKKFLKILRKEKNWPKDSKLTAQDLMDNKDFLLGLNEKRVSYITFNFIPKLLNTFESQIGDKFPKTSSYGGVMMTLSKVGQERWQEAITEGIEFTPFKGLEQLIPFMTPSQKERWDSILEQRPVALSIAALEINFENIQSKEEVEAHKTQLLGTIDGMNTHNDLIQKTIKKKIKTIEQSAHERIMVIDSAAAMVQNLAIEEQSQRQITSPQTQEPDQQHPGEGPDNDNTIADQYETPPVNASEQISNETPVTSISEDAKTKLINIVSILIKNISNGAGGRYTSSINHKKITDLKSILDKLTNSEESGTFQEEYVSKIMDACKIKRNSLHFWATPHSVVEFKALLKDNNIILPSEPQSNGLR
ncbi:hypothetical protein [Legionella bononiensis]|uniref:N-acetyltransferase domain-containing protein n=1 Tax=Legionella bononiensis TaxID=2793102 RepID=A0ABS1W8I7_9GAMM|nr:hypothetical protein [Legionella bononiensis]MBL7479802.1 hypothetical protein [Legionella bononiensis]MBL7525683.1 hypothetical protein [Legionella bononiensis]MBL7561866.1 hypothetical protein [Legionella bononiensis]